MGGRYKPFGWLSKGEKRRRAAIKAQEDAIDGQWREEGAARHAMQIDPEHGTRDDDQAFVDMLEAERARAAEKAAAAAKKKRTRRKPKTDDPSSTNDDVGAVTAQDFLIPIQVL